VGSLEAKLEREKAQKLDVENTSAGLMADLDQEKAKVLTLDQELAEARRNLEAEASEHGMLRAAIRVVYKDLRVEQVKGTSSLAARVIDIMARASALERDAFHAGINQSFMITRSHYGETISLQAMSLGYAPGYDEKELDKLEKAMVPCS
jgi:hypothetical protein